MNTRSPPSAGHLNPIVGGDGNIFRVPNTKDLSGWLRPAEVTDISRAVRSMISVKHQFHTMEVQTQNMFRHLHLGAFLFTEGSHSEKYNNVWQFIRQATKNLTPKSLIPIGINHTSSYTFRDDHEHGQHLHTIQTPRKDGCAIAVQVGGRHLPEAVLDVPLASAQPMHLSQTAEGSLDPESQDNDWKSLGRSLQQTDSNLHSLIKDTRVGWEEVVAAWPQPQHSEPDGLPEQLPLALLASPIEDSFITGTAGHLASERSVTDHCGDNGDYELTMQPPMTVTIPDLSYPQLDDSVAIIGKKDVRCEVATCDNDTSTTQQVRNHLVELQAAMPEELHTWSSHKCTSMRPREETREVIKFKMEEETTTVTNQIRGGSYLAEPAVVVKGSIRARPSLRGHINCEQKDNDQDSGTVLGSYQKALESQAVLGS